jgi:hypothetical protein
MENLNVREWSLIDTDTNLIHVIFRVVIINPVSGPGNQIYMQGRQYASQEQLRGLWRGDLIARRWKKGGKCQENTHEIFQVTNIQE